MLPVADAQQRILERTQPLAPVEVGLYGQALGLVLAQEAASDLDMPPFDKALMDGYALRTTDLSGHSTNLSVIEEVVAGQTPRHEIQAGQATRIMTGAPVPRGADAVIMVERTRLLDPNTVAIDGPLKPGQNILTRGREMRDGEVILRPGTCLGPTEYGLLAATGHATIRAHPRPHVAILPTGDEIVPTSVKPGPGQIRNSNGPMLFAQVQRAGGVPVPIDIAGDRLDRLRPLVERGLQEDVLLLSGGVSAGKLDLVPEVLAGLGVEILFHKVAMKPGKPLLFGVKGKTLVFGLPGNPVSSLVCFELFVAPALRKLAGHKEPGPVWLEAQLEADFPHRSDRETYHPVRLVALGSILRFRPQPWFGSPDLRGLLEANGFARLPSGDHQHQAGTLFPVMPWGQALGS